MAEIGNEFPIQNQGAIPGLGNARVRNDEDEEEANRVNEDRQDQNRVNEERAAENARNEQNLQSDRVNVAGPGDAAANPGVTEQRALRADGELFIVPSQNIQRNLETEDPETAGGNQSVADLNRNAQRLTTEPEGQGPVGRVDALGQPNDPNLGQINQQIEDRAAEAAPSVRQIQQQQLANRPDPAEQRTSAQERTVQQLTEDVVDDGRGQGLAAQAPDNPIIETPSQDTRNITLDRAGLAATSTGRANADDGDIREAIRENVDAQRARRDEEDSQREPERAQTERGQNVDRLI